MPGIQASNSDELLHGSAAANTGTFTGANCTIDGQGRITACSNGTLFIPAYTATNATFVSIANTTETSMIASGTGSLSSTPVAAHGLIFEWCGTLADGGVSTQYKIKIYKGSTVVMDTAMTVNLVSGAGGTTLWWGRVLMTYYSTTTAICTGVAIASSTIGTVNNGANSESATTINSTAETMDMKLTWNAASKTATVTNFVMWAF